MQLAKHTQVNREFFAEGSRLSKQEWLALVSSEAVKGKILGDIVLIDLNAFIANDVMPAKRNIDNDLDLLA